MFKVFIKIIYIIKNKKINKEYQLRYEDICIGQKYNGYNLYRDVLKLYINDLIYDIEFKLHKYQYEFLKGSILRNNYKIHIETETNSKKDVNRFLLISLKEIIS